MNGEISSDGSRWSVQILPTNNDRNGSRAGERWLSSGFDVYSPAREGFGLLVVG